MQRQLRKAQASRPHSCGVCANVLCFDLEGIVIGAGMNRIDYTKGLLESIQALDRFPRA